MKEYKLTADDLAKNFSVPKSTVYYWVREKELPCVRIGTLIRFNPKDVDEWIEKQNKE